MCCVHGRVWVPTCGGCVKCLQAPQCFPCPRCFNTESIRRQAYTLLTPHHARSSACREVGKVDTKHIKVGLAVKTILDNVEEGWEEDQVPVADDNSNLFLETAAPAPSDARPNNAAAEVRRVAGDCLVASRCHDCLLWHWLAR